MWEWALAAALQSSAGMPDSTHVANTGHVVLQHLQKHEPALAKVQVHFVQEARPEPTPLGALVYTAHQCVVVINTQPKAWQQWQRLLHQVPTNSHQATLEAALAHELGHCMQASFGLAMHNGNPSSEELFADIVAMVYTQQQHPEHFEAVAQAFLSTRKHHAKHEPKHNTFAALKQVVYLQRSNKKIWGHHKHSTDPAQPPAAIAANTLGQRSALLMKISQEIWQE